MASFYRVASSSAEVDLVLELAGGRVWAVEIRRSLAPTLDHGFYQAHEDLVPSRSFVVYPGTDRYFLAESVEVIGVAGLASLLTSGEDATCSPEGGHDCTKVQGRSRV